MLITIGTGVLASIIAEVITWLNQKLSGTVLKGDGAFLLATVVALICGFVKVWSSGVPFTNITNLWVTFAQVWTASQAFFVIIVQTFNLDVKATS